MSSKIFKEYYSKLAREGLLKALLCGFIAGFSVAFVMAGIFWMTGFKHWWLGLIVLALVTAGVTALFYTKKFKPSTKKIAARIDELGLEERILTMTELENDTSFIAMKQREDAQAALKTVHAGLLKFAVSVPLIVAVAIVSVFGTGMITVSALTSAGIIPSGGSIVNPPAEPKTFTLNYDVEGEGLIEGDIFQIVEEGYDGDPVIAVADDGYIFVGWSDGYDDPYREDLAVSQDINVTAIFEEEQDGEGEGEGEGDGEGEDSPGQGTPSDQNSNKPGDPSKGGKYEDYNQYMDGKTPYVNDFDNKYQEALEKSEGMTDEDGSLIGDYMNTIAASKDEDEN